MNSRDYKKLRKDCYYHIYNRGNNKQSIFLEPPDYHNFLKRLLICLDTKSQKEFPTKRQRGSFVERSLRITPLPPNAFSILAYCLMPNHYHFLIKQNSDIGIDRLISKVCSSYAWYFNRKYSHVGNIFQDHFKAKLVENDAYLTYLSAYIHNNPKSPINYPFSSFKDYLSSKKISLCDTNEILRYFEQDPIRYKKFVLNFSKQNKDMLSPLLFDE